MTVSASVASVLRIWLRRPLQSSSQLPPHRLRRCRCSQQRRSDLNLTQLPSESACWRYPIGLHQSQSHSIASGCAVRSRAAQLPQHRIPGTSARYSIASGCAVRSRAAATAPHTRHISPFSATTDWRVLCACVGHSAAQSRVASLAHQCMRQTGRTRLVHSSSELALTAATIGPEVDSTAVRLRAGDTRSACTKTRATTSHLAGPFGPEQLPQHRIPGTSASSVPGPTGVCCAQQESNQASEQAPRASEQLAHWLFKPDRASC